MATHAHSHATASRAIAPRSRHHSLLHRLFPHRSFVGRLAMLETLFLLTLLAFLLSLVVMAEAASGAVMCHPSGCSIARFIWLAFSG
jgi:hypothetical protein